MYQAWGPPSVHRDIRFWSFSGSYFISFSMRYNSFHIEVVSYKYTGYVMGQIGFGLKHVIMSFLVCIGTNGFELGWPTNTFSPVFFSSIIITKIHVYNNNQCILTIQLYAFECIQNILWMTYNLFCVLADFCYLTYLR